MKTDQTHPKTIDEYIAGFPQDIQEILEKIRATIREAAPDAEETISYQIPTFALKGYLVHFAPSKSISGLILRPQESRHSEKSYRLIKARKVRQDFHWIGRFPSP